MSEADGESQGEGAWAVACSGPVVRRALILALLVAPLLIVINHGDALARGEWGNGRLVKMALTLLVPYLVSTASSVLGSRESR